MAVPGSLAALSTTASSNPPAGTDSVFPELDDHMRFMYSCLAVLRDSGGGYLASVSGVDTITASLAGLSSLPTGALFSFVPAGANTGAVTLNINALGAKSVTYKGASLPAGFFAASVPVTVAYDGSAFDVMADPLPVDRFTAQTIAGVKTFSSAPLSSVAAVAANALMRKGEVDAADTAVAAAASSALGAAIGRSGHTYTGSDWAYIDKAANLIVQWDYVLIPGTGGYLWTYPTAFASTPFHIGGTTVGSIPEAVNAQSPGLSNVVIDYPSASYTGNAFVFAIGIKA